MHDSNNVFASNWLNKMEDRHICMVLVLCSVIMVMSDLQFCYTSVRAYLFMDAADIFL
jgi:hypothetical protein